MDFFKNGTGWCQRHNPDKKPVKIAALAGTNQFQMFATVSTKNSRGNKRTGSLAESCFTSDGGSISMAARAPGPSFKPQATSFKPQAY
jgi:hypothetical protein